MAALRQTRRSSWRCDTQVGHDTPRCAVTAACLCYAQVRREGARQPAAVPSRIRRSSRIDVCVSRCSTAFHPHRPAAATWPALSSRNTISPGRTSSSRSGLADPGRRHVLLRGCRASDAVTAGRRCTHETRTAARPLLPPTEQGDSRRPSPTFLFRDPLPADAHTAIPPRAGDRRSHDASSITLTLLT